MKKLFLSLLIFVMPVAIFATITAEQEFALNRLSGTAQKYSLGTLLAKTPNVVVGKYSFGVTGQTATSGDVNLLRDLDDSASTITIPDNAVIKQVYIDVLTQPSGASTAIKLQSSGDLRASLAAGSFTGIIAGTPINTAATMIKLTADRVLKATLDGTASAGKWNVYVEYVLGD